MKHFIAGSVFWGILIFVIFCLRKKSILHKTETGLQGKKGFFVFIVLTASILICVLPMGLNPIWNGEMPGHRNQYELLTESILNGHLYIEYDDVDPALAEMDNPYDPASRDALGVSFHWDHAFYNGHYYMYFGIVPVLLVFLPFRIITGMPLTTYHATQLFTALFICGVFATFYLVSKKFFEQMTLGMYLTLSVAVSFMSTWYSSEAPALYCTAISAGICLEIWSLHFFIRAVWVEKNEKKTIVLAVLGSLTGALAFGCRPPIALANLLLIPVLWEFLRRKKRSARRIFQLFLIVLPYIVIGVFLMVYNYIRFDNPFEFGQTYQLTVADQSKYGNLLSQINMEKLKQFIYYFVYAEKPSPQFPYISINGVFLNFPILSLICFVFRRNVRKEIKDKHVAGLIWGAFFAVFLTAVFEALCSPYIMERYRMDVYWLMGLVCFLIIGFQFNEESAEQKSRFSCWISYFALFTICTCFLLWCVPNDSNYTAVYPEKLETIRKVLFLGH